MSSTLAVDIGGTKVAAGLVVADGGAPRVEHLTTVPTPATEGGEAVLQATLGALRAVLDQTGERRPDRVGVSTAGTVEPASGRITHATDLIRGWAGTPLADRLRRELALPVAVLNDVHAHGLGEALHGAAAGARSALVVAVGTGIGGCHVLDGSPVRGGRGVAGHVGHVRVPEAAGMPCSCGRVGHLEALASGSGVERELERRTGRRLRGPEIAALLAGDLPSDLADLADPTHLAEEARAVLTLAGRATGHVVGGLLNVLDPDVVVLGGGLSSVGGPWRASLLDGVRETAMEPVARTPLRFSGLGVHAALCGAAHWAERHSIP